jgi:hypothetical protein
MSRSVAVVPPNTHRIFGPGQVCLDAVAGDLVLARSHDVLGTIIRFFERLRRGIPAEYCWTNHAAIVLNSGPNAFVVQEQVGGANVTPLAQLDGGPYAVVHFEMDADQRADVVGFATWSVGNGYGFLSLPADAFNALTGQELSFGTGNRMVCSTQSCRALERCGLIPDRSPYAVTPAHLAQYAGVILPTPPLTVHAR